MNLRHLRAWGLRAAGLFGRQRRDREFAEELESHLQLHIEDNLRAGLMPQEARRQALIKLGGIEQTKERYRQQRGLPMIEMFIQDLRYSLRRLTKSPGFTCIALLSLALGIGANTAIFSLVNTLFLRPLPVDKPEQLVSIQNVSGGRASAGVSYPNYKDFRDRNDALTGLIGYRFAPLSISYEGVNERVWGYLVTGNYFEVLGVKAAFGRTITDDDDRLPGAHPVTVISYTCWQQRFGADPAAIGRSLIVNGRSYTIIGVLPQGFFGTEVVAAPELWFPMAMQAEIEMGNNWLNNRASEFTLLLGRLNPDVPMVQAEAALNSIAGQLESEYPDINQGKRLVFSPPGFGFSGGMMRLMVMGFTVPLMVIVAFVLLLACTNLANLLLARAAQRRKEVAVRLSLGASRQRLVLQLLTESLLLAIGGGGLGLLLAYWLVNLASGIKLPIDAPLLIDLHIDYRVLIFTGLVSLVTGVLFGLLPALQTTRVDLLPALKDEPTFGGSHHSLAKNGLIVLQVALSLILLIAGGLMMRALQRAQTIRLGFDPAQAVEISFDLRLQGYDSARGKELQKRLLERVRSLPGVESAGIIDLTPVDLHFARSPIFIEGQIPERSSNAPRAMASRMSPGYLQAVNTRLIRGRDFSDQDDENAPPVAIVNEAFARRFWPGQEALGKRFSQGYPQVPLIATTDSPQPRLIEIVGIVEDGKYAGLNEEPQPYVCRPMLQAYAGSTALIVRTQTDTAQMLALLRNEVQQFDPRMPLSGKRLSDKLAVPLLPARITASLLGIFGLLALALAALGIYGVMSQAISRRTHEIGIRMALGAQAADILRLAIGQGFKLTLLGAGIGVGVALALTRFLKTLLFGVSATDPLTYVGITLLLIFVALLACYLPARRATKIDPMVALRYE